VRIADGDANSCLERSACGHPIQPQARTGDEQSASTHRFKDREDECGVPLDGGELEASADLKEGNLRHQAAANLRLSPLGAAE
jgi:hypothetical protein